VAEYFKSSWRASAITRRRALRAGAVAGMGLAALTLAACGGDEGSDSNGSSAANNAPGTPPPAGTNTSAQSAGQPKPGGAMTLYQLNDPPGLDPFRSYNFLVIIPSSFVYGRLLRFKAQDDAAKFGNFEVEPGLAARYEQIDTTQMKFTLRDGVKWHNKPPLNGRPLVAEDVKLAMERYRSTAPQRGIFSMIDSIDTPDTSTVVFKFKYPYAPFTSIIADGNYLFITPPELSSDELMKTMIGTGPWTFESYEPSVVIKFKKNPDYWDAGKPYVNDIDLRIIKDEGAALAQFQSGRVDLNVVGPGSFNRQDIAVLKQSVPKATYLNYEYSSHATMGFVPYYVKEAKTQDERLRQAISMMIDRDAIVKTLWKSEAGWGGFLPAGLTNWFLDPRSEQFGPSAKFFKHNPQEAKQLLSAAGFPDGFEETLHFANDSYGNLYNQQAEVIGRMLNDGGLRIKLSPESFSTWAQVNNNRQRTEGFSIGFSSYYTDPDEYIYTQVSNNPSNTSGISDPMVDKLIADEQQEFDAAKRKTIIHEYQRYMASKMYFMPLTTPWMTFAVQPWIKNFKYGSRFGAGEETYTNTWTDKS
jgi:peptide/nickel transport system substrate-binding protein